MLFSFNYKSSSLDNKLSVQRSFDVLKPTVQNVIPCYIHVRIWIILKVCSACRRTNTNSSTLWKHDCCWWLVSEWTRNYLQRTPSAGDRIQMTLIDFIHSFIKSNLATCDIFVQILWHKNLNFTFQRSTHNSNNRYMFLHLHTPWRYGHSFLRSKILSFQ